jgi:aerobic-type carbon monoxide dehydrogenase small subunit (CoxS/CutS family)
VEERRWRSSAADIEGSITNICRCGTYARIKAAITAVAAG